jgi:hypothetical protein
MDKLIDLLNKVKGDNNISYYVNFTQGPLILTIKFKDGSFLELVEKKSCEHIKQNPKK